MEKRWVVPLMVCPSFPCVLHPGCIRFSTAACFLRLPPSMNAVFFDFECGVTFVEGLLPFHTNGEGHLRPFIMLQFRNHADSSVAGSWVRWNGSSSSSSWTATEPDGSGLSKVSSVATLLKSWLDKTGSAVFGRRSPAAWFSVRAWRATHLFAPAGDSWLKSICAEYSNDTSGECDLYRPAGPTSSSHLQEWRSLLSPDVERFFHYLFFVLKKVDVGDSNCRRHRERPVISLCVSFYPLVVSTVPQRQPFFLALPKLHKSVWNIVHNSTACVLTGLVTTFAQKYYFTCHSAWTNSNTTVTL